MNKTKQNSPLFSWGFPPPVGPTGFQLCISRLVSLYGTWQLTMIVAMRAGTNIYGAFPVNPHEVFTKSMWSEPSLEVSVSPPAHLESVASSQEA